MRNKFSVAYKVRYTVSSLQVHLKSDNDWCL